MCHYMLFDVANSDTYGTELEHLSPDDLSYDFLNSRLYERDFELRNASVTKRGIGIGFESAFVCFSKYDDFKGREIDEIITH